MPALSAENFALSSRTRRSLTVAWDPPNAEDHNGVLTRYVLVYAGAELDQLERLVTLNTSDSGFTTSYTADNLEEDTAYSFSIIAYTVVGSGPALTITDLRTLPDGTLYSFDSLAHSILLILMQSSFAILIYIK